MTKLSEIVKAMANARAAVLEANPNAPTGYIWTEEAWEPVARAALDALKEPTPYANPAQASALAAAIDAILSEGAET